MSDTKHIFNVYRNTRFTKRNYECTNIAACMPVDESAKVPEGYEITPSSILSNMGREVEAWHRLDVVEC